MNINLIVPSGTQIVLLNDTKVLNENRFQPKGTVGVISGLPGDAFHAYKIKFPDQSEAMANRKDFSIRKQFQSEQSGTVSQLENFQLFDFVIYRCVVGSRAFGLDNEESDVDRRGIYLMQTGEIEANLIKLNEVFKLSYLPDLIERKIKGAEKGVLPEADLEFYRKEYERLVSELEKAAEKTNLPERPTAKDELNDLLIRLRLNAFV